MSEKKRILNESSGGYMSVDREEALKKNWDMIQKLTLPGSGKTAEKKQLAASETKPNAGGSAKAKQE